MKKIVITTITLSVAFLAEACRKNSPNPEITVADLARAQGITPVLIEFPAELRGRTIYYEYSTAEGPVDWGSAFEVPVDDSYVKAFIHREVRGVSYVTDEVAYGLQVFGRRADPERHPHFDFTSGAGERPISYKDFKLAFGSTWHAPQLAIGGGRTRTNPENHDWLLIRLVDSVPDGLIEKNNALNRK